MYSANVQQRKPAHNPTQSHTIPHNPTQIHTAQAGKKHPRLDLGYNNKRKTDRIIYVCVCVCVCVYIYISIYIYMFIHEDQRIYIGKNRRERSTRG